MAKNGRQSFCTFICQLHKKWKAEEKLFSFQMFQKLANVISQNEFDCVSQKNMSAIIQKRKEKKKSKIFAIPLKTLDFK